MKKTICIEKMFSLKKYLHWKIGFIEKIACIEKYFHW
jgi:hypothetical protein